VNIVIDSNFDVMQSEEDSQPSDSRDFWSETISLFDFLFDVAEESF